MSDELRQHFVAPQVWYIRDIFTNIQVIQIQADKWILIDAGLKSTLPKIKNLIRQIFGSVIPPEAVILTHGHFDHVGSLQQIIEEWRAPIYAHPLEIPYLTGQASYPSPDPFAGGGMMSLMSFLYPKGPINISKSLNILDSNGSIPYLPDWRYIHTPGHAPGHISLFREIDKVLIAGDALVTTDQESLIAVIQQRKNLSGPPKYFTYNWIQAKESSMKLLNLQPNVIISGHGRPLRDKELFLEIEKVKNNYDTVEIPDATYYVKHPLNIDAAGVTI